METLPIGKRDMRKVEGKDLTGFKIFSPAMYFLHNIVTHR
jgi:hypothetical protein